METVKVAKCNQELNKQQRKKEKGKRKMANWNQ
jgi:hypothetical protein